MAARRRKVKTKPKRVSKERDSKGRFIKGFISLVMKACVSEKQKRKSKARAVLPRVAKRKNYYS